MFQKAFQISSKSKENQKFGLMDNRNYNNEVKTVFFLNLNQHLPLPLEFSPTIVIEAYTSMNLTFRKIQIYITLTLNVILSSLLWYFFPYPCISPAWQKETQTLYAEQNLDRNYGLGAWGMFIIL